ncbi:MAG: HEAT repeat domain-containing protein [Deltaproteobacteria bacterium]|nr:HEAT repeat domain-containing protein [Deltaproteobacteria bacterium]
MRKATSFFVAIVLIAACAEKKPTTREYWDDLLASDKRSDAFAKIAVLKDKAQIDAAMKALGGVVSRYPAQVAGVMERLAMYDADVAKGLRACLTTTAAPQCLRGLGAMRAVEAVPEIRQAARATDAFIRSAAVTALRWMRAKDAVETLGEVALDRVMTPRATPGPQRPSGEMAVREAVLGLGEIGDPRAIPTLLKAIWSEVWTSVFPEARVALVSFGDVAVNAIVAAVDGKDAALAKWAKEWKVSEEYFPAKAILVLGDLGGKVATEKLMALARSDSGYQQVFAIQALGNLAPAEAGPVLVEIAKKSTTAEVLQAALTALPRLNYPPAIDFCLKAMGDKKAPGLKRLFAGLAVSIAGDERHAAAVGPIARAAAAEAKARAAVAAAKKTPDAHAEAGEARDLSEAFQTVEARLTAAKGCAALDCWIAKVRDANPRIRDLAAYKVARLATAAERDKAAAAIAPLLSDKEHGVRRAALYAVTRLGAKSALPALENVIRSERGTEFKVLIPEYQLAIARIGRAQG